jgi:alpha-N-arabinofuranosidase
MRIRLAAALAIASCLIAAAHAAAQDAITVDTTTVVTDVSRRPIGINVNFLLDDDANRINAVARLAEALKAAGVKYLRYPGGEKSDNYLWSVPPYATSEPTLARWATGEYPQNQEWPSYDRQLVEADGRSFKVAPLDFDEFMAVCREINCVPTIVICYDSMYKAAQPGGVAPTRDQLLETAREWVRYANVTKRYNIKYWEIGNESYLAHYNGGATAANYARDLIDFSRVMKGVDPTILIGANGESDSWWRTILTAASGAIDFLAVHNYPASNWGGYSYYRNNNVNLLGTVQAAERAVNSYAPAADRARLTIAVTETNTADWSGGWPHRNDLGHAVALLDTFGSLLAHPRVAFAQLWNTRWSGNDTATTPVLWDALDKHNELQATGRATAIWGQFLKQKLVSSSSTAMVRTYATSAPSSGRISVLLINKDTVARSTSVTLKSGSAKFLAETWIFSGDGADDLYPSWVRHGQNWKIQSPISVTLPPVSVTVLDLTPDSLVHAVPGTIQAEDFADRAYADSTPGNAGGAYRATDVDIQATSDLGGGFNVGWIGAGEWLDYTIRVQTAGFYDFSARLASPYAGKSFRVLLNGQSLTGPLTVPTTGAWQTWQTVTHARVYLTAGTHRATFAAMTDGFNVNWLSLAPSVAKSHAVPGVIQAEDFDDGGYWDTTPGNLGNVYRATDVDLQPTTDAGGGFNVGWVTAGEWLEFTVHVATAGYYDVATRVASPHTGKSFRMLANGVDVTGAVSVPNTGAHQNWQTVTRPRIYLAAGTHRLRLVAITNSFNLNWISLTKSP